MMGFPHISKSQKVIHALSSWSKLVAGSHQAHMKGTHKGLLGGLVLEHLPLAQIMMPGSWDRVPHRAPHKEPASPLACVSVSLSLCVSHEYINKSLK